MGLRPPILAASLDTSESRPSAFTTALMRPHSAAVFASMKSSSSYSPPPSRGRVGRGPVEGSLLAFPDGRALLEEGADALLGIGGHQVAGDLLGHQVEGIAHVLVELLVEGLLAGANGDRAQAADLGGQLGHLGVEVVGLDDG